MPLLHCFPLPFPFPHSQTTTTTTTTTNPFNSPNITFFAGTLTERRSSSRLLHLRAQPITDQQLLQILTESAASDKPTHLPSLRSYETDLARLILVGSVSSSQALIAAAADGGTVAEEHLASGASTMVVETVFPTGSDEHTTISTRLFLPTEMVKEKARKLRSSLAFEHILHSKDGFSNNILAMTFRQVVFQHLWSFQLALFRPGTERNMEDLENTREDQSDFIVNSSDERFISSLAEVVSYCALENAKSKCIKEAGGLHSKSTFHWFQKPQKTSSNDSSISICRISESEVAKEARSQVETYKLMKGRYVNRMKKMKYGWWVLPDCASLDLIGGPGFGSWTCEFIPTYKLQIHTTIFKDVKLEGCHKLADNSWEVLLTHNQMVELANILDMYYEDRYTMPDKKLLLSTETPVTLKRKSTQWKFLFSIFAGGCAIMIFGILAQLSWPKHARKVAEVKHINSVSEVDFCNVYSLENDVVETVCVGIINSIKDELGWPGDVMVDKDIGVWTGTLPSYLKNRDHGEDAISGEVRSSFHVPGSENHEELSTRVVGNPLAAAELELQKTTSDIASYQAVLTRDGKLIGFQPTSRAAVNHWSSNPLAKSLYGAKKLSPGLLEPGLNIPPPRDPIPIELLMSVKPESRFALARPIQE